MKRNTIKWTKWHTARALNQFRRKISSNKKKQYSFGSKPSKRQKPAYVKIWQGGPPETAICSGNIIAAPQSLCFDENAKQTTKLISELRKRANFTLARGRSKFVHRRSETAIPRVSGYVDFSKIAEISMSAAVVFCADYYRLKHFLDEVPPTIDLHKWDPSVVSRLHQLGFFSLLGHEPEEQMLVESGTTVLMRIIQSKNSNDLKQVDEALHQICADMQLAKNEERNELDNKIRHMLTIVSEAMSNVTQHAYPEDFEFDYKHMDSFWISAETNKSERSLKVVMYDQGASIPKTYPRLTRRKMVAKYLRRALNLDTKFDYDNDGTYIRAALRYGGSRTDEDYRGKGFPQMHDLLDNLGGGELKIRSAHGWCKRDCNGKVTSGTVEYSIGGTLVEWKIEL